MSVRRKLTPHTFEYEEKTINEGKEVNWVPYLMFFHPHRHTSDVVNTDSLGFRYSQRGAQRYSVGDQQGVTSARLLVGSSTAFGIGASSDRWTLSSCLAANDSRAAHWLNFGGLAFNSAQELLLLMLHRHLLPKVEEIVLFTGFNNLVLARQPRDERLMHGAFYNSNRYFDMVATATGEGGAGLRGLFGLAQKEEKEESEVKPSLQEQIARASELTLRHLDGWRVMAADLGAKLTFVLQPVALWVRQRGSKEEEALFAEFNQLGNFLEIYGDILTRDACLQYAAALKSGAERMHVRFINFSSVLAEITRPDQWLFVDRIHFTDQGHDLVSKALLDLLK